jgi:hypothetical protein
MTPNCGYCRACAIHFAPDLTSLSLSEAMIMSPLNRPHFCETCGNKRCPHATDHRLACTTSNESNQPGSSYQVRYSGDELQDPSKRFPEDLSA